MDVSGGAERTPGVLLRTRLHIAQLPSKSRLAIPAGWPSVPTHNLAQTAHLMDGSWREPVSLGWLDTQRNLITVRDFVTVLCYGNRMPISPGDPRGCTRPKASRGISQRDREEAEAEAGPGKSLS